MSLISLHWQWYSRTDVFSLHLLHFVFHFISAELTFFHLSHAIADRKSPGTRLSCSNAIVKLKMQNKPLDDQRTAELNYSPSLVIFHSDWKMRVKSFPGTKEKMHFPRGRYNESVECFRSALKRFEKISYYFVIHHQFSKPTGFKLQLLWQLNHDLFSFYGSQVFIHSIICFDNNLFKICKF